MTSKALIRAKTNKSNKIDGTFFDKPIITVKEARKLLGVQYENMDNDEILEVIRAMSSLAGALLDCHSRSTNRKGEL